MIKVQIQQVNRSHNKKKNITIAVHMPKIYREKVSTHGTLLKNEIIVMNDARVR